MLKVNISTAPVSELAQFILSPPKVKAPDTVIAESKIPPSITEDIPANETNSLASQGSLASAFFNAHPVLKKLQTRSLGSRSGSLS